MKNSQHKQELEEFIAEAAHVREMTNTPGWEILRRDIDRFIHEANKAWTSINPDSPQFKRLQVDVLAFRKLIDIVEDYESNRIQAERKWLQEQFPELYVQADVDNETPLRDKED